MLFNDCAVNKYSSVTYVGFAAFINLMLETMWVTFLCVHLVDEDPA